jgi:hypothetical protein
MNNPDHIFLELRNHFFAFFGVEILKFYDEDPGSGMETVRIRDPGWKKVGSGIRDVYPGSATLDPSWELQSMACFCMVNLACSVIWFLEKNSVNFTASG